MRHIDNILARQPAHRLMSVDCLRGLAIAAMVVVNNPGSWSYVYAPLAHATWHGWTPTDVIFPLFLFVVGVSIVLANGRAEHFPKPGAGHWSRAAKLFGLGLFLALFYIQTFNPDFNWWRDQLLQVRWLGVLQRIALVYIASCYLVWLLDKRGLIIATLLLLALPYAMMLWVPYADAQGQVYRGVLAHGNHFSAWLDQWVLGSAHVYYKTATPFAFDPEGLLTTLPAIASCLLGVLAGLQWRATPSHEALGLVRRWLLLGALLLAAGQLAHLWVPINKALWTPSFVAVCAGVSYILLALCYYLCDVRQWRRPFAPLVVFGVNAIALFMLAGVVGRLLVMIPVGDMSAKQAIFSQWLAPLLGNYPASLTFSLLCLLLFYAAMWQLFKRGIIWKV
ncbi:heparan-alpha-glucosaminide N-acetyltransferase domain-containing protein [Simiduia sp. 21SJ11W-1]|uniref:acyltransferase family protein n=1 Tax=Simiduia sp. 21SJ11W-1 TaxID=2909669 RepID=UPI00209FB20A|nr:heparan-alpha-glucosaminide N-acetyltransferase domain-containing protein [Simiduia sp. 21SJ11W-1]UTA48410.1 heparan-alpha-glucosaminide N-acetyltransferase domain-containing protein [Simiduia sp. 21SJ11W-1]